MQSGSTDVPRLGARRTLVELAPHCACRFGERGVADRDLAGHVRALSVLDASRADAELDLLVHAAHAAHARIDVAGAEARRALRGVDAGRSDGERPEEDTRTRRLGVAAFDEILAAVLELFVVDSRMAPAHDLLV